MKTRLPAEVLLAAVMLGCVTGCKHIDEPRYVNFDGARRAVKPKAGAHQFVTFTNNVDPTWLHAPTNLFTLGPGDRLDIDVLDEPSAKTTTTVGPDGKIYFALLPGIDVWGLTLGQAREAIEHDLTRYVRGNPRINLTLREVQSKRVWMLGRFQAPGVYTMSGPMTLLEGISMAGGPMTFAGTKDVSAGPLGEDLADLKHSFIVRNGHLLPVDFDRLLNRGDVAQNIYLQPDDFVYFSPSYARQVYVLGAVLQPRPVTYTDGMTVAMAIAGAYGTVRDAYLYHVVVLRGSLTQPEVTVVDYKAVVHGDAPDVTLEPHDIVFVPWAPYRYLRRYLDIALNTFVSSVAINAGVRMVGSKNATGAGIFIPVGSGIQVIPPTPPPIGR